MPNKRKNQQNMTVREASVYWDTHSVADVPSRVVRFEYHPADKTGTVNLANDLMRELMKRARRQHVSVETLINLWIQEKLTA